MKADSSEEMLIKRLEDEVLALFEGMFQPGGDLFENAHIPLCWATLKCEATECDHSGREQRSLRCWQIPDTPCNGQPPQAFPEKFMTCRTCDVFQQSCPTIVERIGESFNNLMHLIGRQSETIEGYRKEIEQLRLDLSSVQSELDRKNLEMEELLLTDKLTQLYNRQHLVTVLGEEIARSQRYGHPLALMMIDIDELRHINDVFGDQSGDVMLSFAATLIRDNVRKFDRAFRYGGEEFVIVLPETDATMAFIVAERIRRGFCNKSFRMHRINTGSEENASGTLSIGVTAIFSFRTNEIRIEELISQTESALQSAKKRGGNMSITYQG